MEAYAECSHCLESALVETCCYRQLVLVRLLVGQRTVKEGHRQLVLVACLPRSLASTASDSLASMDVADAGVVVDYQSLVYRFRSR